MTNIDEILQQAERQQEQLKLNLQFQKNMELFKKYAPQIYNQFISYTPKELQLSYDNEGNINLVNANSGAFVYNRPPKTFIGDQLEHFKQSPKWLKIGFKTSESDLFFQHTMVDHLITGLNTINQNVTGSTSRPIGVMIINGCGLGYHITEIVENHDISTLCIFDPHKDSFYASLHTIDWEPIILKFYSAGKLIKLFIGSTKEKAMMQIRIMTDRIGLHNICNTYIFDHLASQESIDFTNMVKEQFHLTLTGTGFLEDEQIGIAHTVANLNKKTPVLNNNEAISDLPPAFIVGNGPSLDGLLPLLKKQGENAIIFSCGSTLSTLFNEGITPDFHIEMERTDDTFVLLNETTTSDYLKNITLLCLNTVTPKTLELFADSFMAIKMNDPGENLINSELKASHSSLNVCNPTCTNTGLAYALRMGFKEIYLLGVDLGMKDKNLHHAKSSAYYAKKLPKVLEEESTNKAKIVVKGNFSESVSTTAILDTSRANIEIALANYPDVTTYNLNDGAYIEGAIPTPLEKVELGHATKTKENTIRELKEQNFTSYQLNTKITEEILKKKYLSAFFSLRKQLKIPESPKDLLEIINAFNKIIQIIYPLRNTDPVSYWLISGSTQTFFTLIQNYCFSADDEKNLISNYLESKKVYEEFLSKAYTLIRSNSLEVHDFNKRHQYN